jgi:hypothetical protein
VKKSRRRERRCKPPANKDERKLKAEKPVLRSGREKGKGNEETSSRTPEAEKADIREIKKHTNQGG